MARVYIGPLGSYSEVEGLPPTPPPTPPRQLMIAQGQTTSAAIPGDGLEQGLGGIGVTFQPTSSPVAIDVNVNVGCAIVAAAPVSWAAFLYIDNLLFASATGSIPAGAALRFSQIAILYNVIIAPGTHNFDVRLVSGINLIIQAGLGPLAADCYATTRLQWTE